jgi:dipeptidase D
MSSAIEGLEPQLLWKHFAALSRIPRGSKNEAAAAQYVLDTARQLGLEARQDAVGNVLVEKPATPGKERAASVCLQSHLDMVCEKNADKAHDFTKDPIELVREGNVLRANGTTLGADNGIGVATALAVAEDRSLEHGPLEMLFTIDEETGLTGAQRLEPGFFRSRILLNLDS